MDIFILLFLYLTAFQISKVGSDYSYNPVGLNGPSHWANKNNTCNGKHQSPISINELTVVHQAFTQISYGRFDLKPLSAKLLNNGHTVVLKLQYEQFHPFVIKGPLDMMDQPYRFAQLHFHWGGNDTFGSEDIINNKTFPAELHMVFFADSHKHLDTAVTKEDGVAVLAYFFEISQEDNPGYTELVELLEKIQYPEQEATFFNPPTLKSLISLNFDEYFTYKGSLTTPPCSENVFWIDFTTPIPISPYQIAKFRTLYASNGKPLMNNFRPVQPLNDRVVYKAQVYPSLNISFGIPFVYSSSSGTIVFKTTIKTLICSLLMLAGFYRL